MGRQEMYGHTDRRAYNPSRDMARAWPAIVKPAISRFLEGKGVGGRYLTESAPPQEVVQAGLESLRGLLFELNSDQPIPLQKALAKHKLLEQDQRFLTALFASFGASFLGAIYGATCDLKVLDEDPPVNGRTFEELAERLTHQISKVES